MNQPGKANRIKNVFKVPTLQAFGFTCWIPFFIGMLLANTALCQVDSTVLTSIDSLIKVNRTIIKEDRFEEAKNTLAIIEMLVEENLKEDFKLYAAQWDKLGVEWKSARLDLDKAEKCFLNALDVRREGYGEGSAEYASNLNNLGSWYQWYGWFEKAEPMYLEALKIMKSKEDSITINYAIALHNLGALNVYMGNYERAEEFYLESIEGLKITLGMNHRYYPMMLNNLSILFSEIGQYRKAEKLELEVKSIRENLFGIESLDYCFSLKNLGVLYLELYDFKRSEKYLKEALKILKLNNAENGEEYLDCLASFGWLNMASGNLKKADSLYSKSLIIRENIQGKEHPHYIKTLGYLAFVHLKLNNLERSIKYYTDEYEALEKVFDKKYHPAFAEHLRGSMLAYGAIGNKSAQKKAVLELFYNLKNQVELSFSFLSENQMEKFISSKIVSIKNSLQSVIYSYPYINLEYLQYDLALFEKGLQLQTSKNTLEFIFQSQDSTIKDLYYKMLGTLRQIAKEYEKPISKQNALIDLFSQQETYEKQLARASATFRQHQAASKITHKEVKEALKPGEIAIEFVHFNYYNPERTDSVIFAAAILLPNAKHARFIPLFEEDQLYNLMGQSTENQVGYKASLYTSSTKNQLAQHAKNQRGTRKNKVDLPLPEDRLTPKEQANLYSLIWQPLDSLLEGVETIYYAPSGLLNRLNLGAIPIDEKIRMQDRYQLRWLSSTRQLALEEDREEAGALDALVYGGIQYDYDSLVIAEQDTNGLAFSKSNYFDLTSRSLRGETWNYLEGTEAESQKIHQLLAKNSYNSTLKSGYQATEESFKQIGMKRESPQVIHLATHGFFFPDPEKSPLFFQERGPGGAFPYQLSDNPMIRSGLIMTGANHAWQGGETLEGLEDGILTSYEISQLNLTNTELVVLSACETGLGDIKGSEGVFGLQRAFKKAGVNYLIMSLWQVPDQETKEFMVAFYEYWLEDEMSIPEAFQATQQEMRKRYKDPYKWAGFVLLE